MKGGQLGKNSSPNMYTKEGIKGGNHCITGLVMIHMKAAVVLPVDFFNFRPDVHFFICVFIQFCYKGVKLQSKCTRFRSPISTVYLWASL